MLRPESYKNTEIKKQRKKTSRRRVDEELASVVVPQLSNRLEPPGPPEYSGVQSQIIPEVKMFIYLSKFPSWNTVFFCFLVFSLVHSVYLYSVQCTVYSVHVNAHIFNQLYIQLSLNIQELDKKSYSVYTLYTVYLYTTYSVQCKVYIHCTLRTVYSVKCTVNP